MGRRAGWALLAVLLVAFASGVVTAGQRDEAPPPLPGVERLGPESGEPVEGYLERAARSLPAAGGGQAWALVQLNRQAQPDAAARLAQRVRLARVVLRVPLPRVQTALITRSVPGRQPAAEMAAALRAAAGERTAAAAAAPEASRAAAVAAAEARRLRAGCECVVAMLVRADRAALAELADREGVRAVHAAQPGTPLQGLALAPLLPQQDRIAGPVPDDGPVP